MATLPGLSVGLTLNSATFIAETRRVEASVSRLGQSVNAQSAIVQKGFGGMSAAAGILKSAIIGLVGAFSLTTIVRLGTQALDTAGNLGELAAAAGISTKQLQVLTLAGVQVGVSQEQMVTAIGLFNRNIGQAANGTGAFAETLQRVGIGIRDANGNIRSAEVLLNEYADAIQNAGSEQEQLALAQEAFGRGGRILINVFKDGSEGLKAFAEQAQAAGLILSDEFIAQADQASDAIATLQLAAQRGFQIGVIEAFGDAVSSSTDALSQAREAGEAFGQAVGTALRAGAAAAAFVARNWRELATAGAFLIGLKLGSVLGVIAAAMVRLAVAIRAGATAMVIFNAVVGKNIFVILGKAIVGAGLALATWLAITKQATAETDDLASELVRINALFDDTGDGIVEASDAVKEHAKTLASAVEQAKRENEQLTILDEAYAGVGASIETVQLAMRIDDQLRAQKITRLEAEESGLLELLVANEALTESIEAQAEAERSRLAAAGQSFDELARLTEQTFEGINEEQQRQADLAAELMLEPFENALGNIQSLMADTFEQIFDGTIDNFNDLGSAILDIFTRLAAEIATLMVIQPVLGAFGGGGGFGGLLSGAAGLLSGGGGASFVGLPGAGPGGIQGLRPAAAAGSSWGGLFAAGAVGALSGSIIGPLIFGGGQSQVGGGIGGGLGAGLGFALSGGNPIGGLIGGGLGSLLGGAIGSVFGGSNKEDNEGDLRFLTGRGSVFDRGAFGSLTIGGENSFAGPLRDIIRKFDEGVSQYLTDRQKELAENAVQALPEFEGRFLESDPSEGFAAILKERGSAILKAAFSKINVDKVLEGASGIDEIGLRIQTALQTITTFNELTGSMASPAEQLAGAIASVRSAFAEIRPIARALGLDIGLLNAAMRGQIAAVEASFVSLQEQARIQNQIVRNTRASFRDDLARAGPLTNRRALKLDLRAVNREFFERRQTARELDIPIREVRAAHRAAREEVKRQHRENRIAERQNARAADEARQAQRAADRQAGRDAAQAARDRARADQQARNDAAETQRREAQAAREQARIDATNKAALIDQLTSFLPTANPLELALREIDRQFRQLGREAAELGVSLDLVRQAAKAARQAARAEHRERIAEVKERIDVLRGTEAFDSVNAFKQSLHNLNEAFRDVMDAARELGIAVTGLGDANAAAIKKLKEATKLQIEAQALGVSQQFDAILDPLRAFQNELSFSIASPVEQFKLARQEFERIAKLAKGGDLAAIAALPAAGRLFLEQAGQFGASPARVAAEEKIQDALTSVIQATTKAQERATEGIENEIRRASNREVDTLNEMIEQGRETVRELKRLRAVVQQANRTA